MTSEFQAVEVQDNLYNSVERARKEGSLAHIHERSIRELKGATSVEMVVLVCKPSGSISDQFDLDEIVAGIESLEYGASISGNTDEPVIKGKAGDIDYSIVFHPVPHADGFPDRDKRPWPARTRTDCDCGDLV